MPRDFGEEWQALVRQRDEALARSRLIQAEIADVLRRRQPPSRQLLREADAVASELAAARARVREFLRRVGAVE